MAALPFDTVTNENELNQDLAAIAGGTASYTITFGSGFTLNTDLLAVNLGAGGSLTLQGAGKTINGAGSYRGFLVYRGDVTIDDLALDNMAAIGGNGGNGEWGGGGGPGLGGGLFVGALSAVTLNGVSFLSDKAIGGNGGAEVGGTTGAGGGGGMGGNGGAATGGISGGGGGVGRGASGGSAPNGASAGIIPGGEPGGSGASGEPGGANGGGGGFGFPYGGIGGGHIIGDFKGDIGRGGGGSTDTRVYDGHGLFGGGGGGSAGSGGNGGFGGGGGGNAVNGGIGGFGGGNGGGGPSGGGGGGGLGAGGDIFVQQGGKLTIGAGTLGAGTVTAGSGANNGSAGKALGSSVFIAGGAITFATVSGQTTQVAGVIADQGRAGADSLIVSGSGTLKLDAASTYVGRTTISTGTTLELASPDAAGSGRIKFTGAGILRIDTLQAPVNTIIGPQDGEVIDLAALPFVGGATATISVRKLTVTSGGVTETLNVEYPITARPIVKQDASGGTEVTFARAVFASEPPLATVKDESELNRDLAAIAGGMESYTITLGSSFTLNTDLLAVNLGAGGALTLQGNGQTINGGGTHRGFFDYAGALVLDNLTIENAVAAGGSGGTSPTNGSGAGGGGAGLGGGLFVASAGNATLNNVTFTNDKALGGSGGSNTGSSTLAAGGGGGLGGNGGDARQVKIDGDFFPEDGSGGGIGLSATGGSLSTGGSGIVPTGPDTRIGGGGGTGFGKDYVSGNGGVQPGSFGGGGEGRVQGGFGGGGGGSRSGGFGGGGGGSGGRGGFGGGDGGINSSFDSGGGGGGLGAGADVFVQAGGQLTIGAASLGVGTVAGGRPGSTAGGTQATAGSAFGNGIFIQGNQSITFAPPSGVTTTISSIIADMNGSIAGSGGAGSVIMNGVGTLKLAIAEPYTGGTFIGNGRLELVTPTAAGTGNIRFGDVAPGGPAVLQIDTLAQPTNTITGLGTGDTIDLRALPFVGGATAKIVNNKLTVTSGGQTVTLNVQSADATLAATKDASGGTDVSPFFSVVKDEAEFNKDLSLIAGTTTAQRITIGASFHLTEPLLAINLGVGGSLTIDGGGFVFSGNGMAPPEPLRGLMAYSGNVTINNLGLDGMRAQGGRGGFAANPGGGGAGLGGGLLIASGGAVTLNNVTFSNDSASGGPGGNFRTPGFAGGGGGGLGGPGGDGLPGGPLDFTSDGGGGGVGSFFTGRGGTKGFNDGKGEGGLVPGAPSGGSGGQGTPGGINGGGGGDAGHGDGGGGGIGGQAGNSAGNNYGGNGGWGGGGGGGGSGFFDRTNGGGSGGFGGGAGGAANSAHTGGFGGGGGGGGDSPGVAGVGGGAGGGSNFGGGGGGAGLGADIFVQQGGKLTITGGTLGAGTVQAGAGGKGRTPENSGHPGIAAGPTIFEQGKQAITFAPGSGQTLTVQGGIGDENALRPGAGAGSVVVAGDGTVKLVADDSYTGGTLLQSGRLELVSEGAAGTGAITFGAGSSTLQLDYVRPGATAVSQVIRFLGSGASRIYLPNVSAKDITFESDIGKHLKFEAGNATYTFNDLGESAGDTINATDIVADKSGQGVDILASPAPAPANEAGTVGGMVTPSDLSVALAFDSGNSPTFLASSIDPGIDDQVSRLAMNGGADIFQSVGNEPSAVADLTGGVGGFTKAAGVMSVLAPEGTGGLLPAFGVGQSVDALAVAPSVLHAGNFQINQAS